MIETLVILQFKSISVLIVVKLIITELLIFEDELFY
jgi:hypothetical protein